jgi:hypothetical protein
VEEAAAAAEVAVAAADAAVVGVGDQRAQIQTSNTYNLEILL